MSPDGRLPADSPVSTVQRARAIYDYDARDSSEMSLMADEIIAVSKIEGTNDDDYLMGERGNQRGKVPKAFLEMLTY
jgi:hypothetical protein